MLSRAARTALETLATEAAVAIENARLYRETLNKAKMEQEMRIAAEIQQALLPEPRRSGGFFEAVGASLPCRSIGGDFFDYVDLPDGEFRFAVGDVAGKGAPAALLTAVIQGVFASQASSGSGPAAHVGAREPGADPPRDRVALRHGLLRGRAKDGSSSTATRATTRRCSFGRKGVERLEKGGLILGLFEHATFEEETVPVEPGDLLITFSDGSPRR